MIFCDFGEEFTIYDTDGEQPVSNMIAGITKVILYSLTLYNIYLPLNALTIPLMFV